MASSSVLEPIVTKFLALWEIDKIDVAWAALDVCISYCGSADVAVSSFSGWSYGLNSISGLLTKAR